MPKARQSRAPGGGPARCLFPNGWSARWGRWSRFRATSRAWPPRGITAAGRRPLDLLGVWHKELEVFFLTGKQAGIQPIQAKRLREMLTALNAVAGPF